MAIIGHKILEQFKIYVERGEIEKARKALSQYIEYERLIEKDVSILYNLVKTRKRVLDNIIKTFKNKNITARTLGFVRKDIFAIMDANNNIEKITEQFIK